MPPQYIFARQFPCKNTGARAEPRTERRSVSDERNAPQRPKSYLFIAIFFIDITKALRCLADNVQDALPLAVHGADEGDLAAGAVEVVRGAADFVVAVAVEVVG